MPEKNKARAHTQEALKKGARFSLGHTTLSYYKKLNIGPLLVFVVSKKVSLRATKRNLIKRRARFIIRKEGIVPNKNEAYIFVFRSGADKILFKTLKEEIVHTFLLKKRNEKNNH